MWTVKAHFRELFAAEKLRNISCPGCGKYLVISPDAPITGDPAHACSCGAVYCPACYRDRLRGSFGEELKSLPIYIIPVASLGYYLAVYTPTLAYTGAVVLGSILGGFFINHSLYLPLSRVLRVAKQCRVCGGRTFADWHRVSIVELEGDSQPEPEAEPESGSESPAPRRRRLLDELDPT